MGARGPKSRKVYTPIGNVGIDEQFFFSHLIDTENDCLEWTGARHPQGYGMVGIIHVDTEKRTMEVAHRVAWMLNTGQALGRYDFVYHRCANNRCCNPEHLAMGEPKKRKPLMDESRAAGMAPPQGRRNRYYRYTDDEVRWIRTASSADIAERFGIDKNRAAAIRSILKKKTYQWVK